ncbi:MAG: PEFG-CTERM sorting domain-containing protein [Nitrosopumilus sp.]|nr:PEFG-CTERM sorting domain-containing protein [Nitrosopumilus sp.]MDH3737275.1 PEFG-CTERM sorting domain-containing protein [Nitrosopumilus sp.]MDH3822666.1 PEFG-CTERM sorting domain-containing protein [Nitrosopumilus sp.]MDH3833163.1 PEFG-CTERM sorting domain-containing protein [Nitrosopumilus sp.]
MKKGSKTILMILIAISFVSTSAFAEPSIEISASSENIKSLDSVLITGKITGVTEYKPVKLIVTDPNGIIVYAPAITIGDNGEFRKLLQPTLPSFMAGTYTVTAGHEETNITAQTQFTVTTQDLPRNQITQPVQESVVEEEKQAIISGITMSADAIEGSDTIKIVGNTSFWGADITFVVNSPTGNIVTVAQVTPGLNGDFEVGIKIGGPMWKEDGMYTITANQGTTSEHKESIKVEIKEGLVIPEFGTIVSLVLVVSIFAIIMFSAKSKLGVFSRY